MTAPPKYNGPLDGREAYIATLPENLRHLICTCHNASSDKLGFTRVHERGDFWVRACCRKPPNLWTYINECDGCGDYYVAEFYPDVNLLCPPCRIANDIELPDPDEWLRERVKTQHDIYN